MVGVDIYVPCADETFHFSLEENETIAFLIDGAGRVVEEMEGTGGAGKDDIGYLLISRSHGHILNPDKTLAYYGIRTGDALVLI